MSLGGIIVSYKLEDIDIDKVATAANASDFLEGTFQTYLNRAGLHRADLSSPKMDITGVSAHGGNSAESGMMKIFDYEAKCWAIYKAIDNCRENKNKRIYSRSILIDLYIKELEPWQIKERLGLSDSSYKIRRQKALCEFADRLPVWAYRLDTHFPELRKYSNKEKEVIN